MVTNLEQLPPGRNAVVVALGGGRGMVNRLEAMGVRPGKQVRKVSTQFMAGPITVLVNGRQLAMGRGIARRIQVDAGG
ncbi:MAG: ferrous iron transport protein A [Candidatus Brocadiaceae bacterium]|nr:ferrous iron transport protein A [Candidatus Brocadiaceae bacterium]